MTKWFMVMMGGSLGALCRYGISVVASKQVVTRFPLGTLLVNLVGCFLIGVAFALSERTQVLPPSARLFFMTGFLGALTTFSTYAIETLQAIRSGSNSIAVINFMVNNLGGVILVLAGMLLVQFIFSGE